jgi:thiamine-phosphate pyrophosphorylase
MFQLPHSPFLYPILDADFSTNLLEDAREIIRAGAKIVQIRAKNQTKKWLYDRIQRIVPICEEGNVCCLVNDCVDIALVSDVAGVHLGQTDFPVPEARELMGSKIIGFSTHTFRQFSGAGSLPADYIAVGPVFPTRSKANADPALGLPEVERIVQNKRKPVVAIGGILPEHVLPLIRCGVDGIAVISALYQDGKIYDNACRLQEKIRDNAKV